jgi:hypothetical protein
MTATLTFFALHRDEVLLSAPSLDDLLGGLAAVPDVRADVAVWHGPRLAAVRHADGRVTRFDPAAGQDDGGLLDDDDDGTSIDLAALARDDFDLPF